MSTYLRARYPSDIAGLIPLRIVGCVRAGANVRYRRGVACSWVAGAAAVLIWQTILATLTPDPFLAFTRSVVWSLYFCAAILLVIAALHVSTQRFLSLTNSLDEVLTERGRESYDHWYRRLCAPPYQLAAGLFLAGVAVVALRALVMVIGNRGVIIVNAPSYVIIALVGFFVGAVAYLALGCILLCVSWGRRGRLRLNELMPAFTAGLEELSRLVLHVLFGAVVLAAVMLFPTLFATSQLPHEGVPEGTRTLARVLQIGLLGLCGVTITAVGIVPQEALSAAIRDQRQDTMRLIERQLRAEPKAKRRATLEERYERVAGSPTSTLGAANVVQIVVASATALTPFAVSIIAIR
jgi:hypothetical protein